ncbi:MAG: YCF48-related protein, partial [Candidatus Andersenbacteria bacterium]
VPEFIKDPSPLGRVSGTKEVFDVAFIPQFPDALFVGVEDGAVVTRDGGESWLQLSVPVELTQKFNIVRVAVSPTNPDRLFVAVNSVLYRSEDGGATWNTFSFNIANSVVSEISINPLNASQMLAVIQRIQS